MKPTESSPATQSFRDWSHNKPLAEALSRAEAGVRAKPQEASARWLLFELWCVLGQWERALKQLQAWAGLSKASDSTAHVMRGLIRAEQQRNEVFAGTRAPATVMAGGVESPAWIAGLGEALRLAAAQGEAALQASDLARQAALAQAPEAPGCSNLQPAFAWITDADTRLGPVCEVVLLGAYRWLPFSEIASITKAAPMRLLDLVWSQVSIVLHGSKGDTDAAGSVGGEAGGAGRAELKGYMPMRYPVHSGERDALLLARETVWDDVGRTGVHARGQKMWMTDAGDMALLDLRECDFGGDPDQAAALTFKQTEAGQGYATH